MITLRIFIVVLLLIAFVSSSCQNEANKENRTLKPIRPAGLDTIITPIWSDADFSSPLKALMTMQVTSNTRPPYAPGQGRFQYSALKMPMGGGFGGPIYMTYFYKIDLFTTEFSYANSRSFLGLPSGARTLDASNRLRAEAKIKKLIKEEGQPLTAIEIEEFHYNEQGELIFTCISRVEPGREWKTSEYNTIGTKERDYYPVWPISRFR